MQPGGTIRDSSNYSLVNDALEKSMLHSADAADERKSIVKPPVELIRTSQDIVRVRPVFPSARKSARAPSLMTNDLLHASKIDSTVDKHDLVSTLYESRVTYKFKELKHNDLVAMRTSGGLTLDREKEE